MDLKSIRNKIDDIDKKILELFVERMALASDVANYKRQNGMEVYQEGRENEVLERISKLSPPEFEKGARMLFANIMDISKTLQTDILSDEGKFNAKAGQKINPHVACQGTKGSYSEVAYEALFSGDSSLEFHETFDEVFKAVDNGKVDYGILPIENNTAGDVAQTYELMNKYNFYISKVVAIPINHVLACVKGADFSQINKVYSHEQALRQCSGFFENNPSLMPKVYENTATAAKMVAEKGDFKISAICSAESARLYNLDIIRTEIADNLENYTRFICISKDLEIDDDADTISVALSTRNEPAALYRLLTKFAVNGLNLTKIENKPLPATVKKEHEFDVLFYLDFTGSVRDLSVSRLLNSLENGMKFYKFLGNYKSIIKK